VRNLLKVVTLLILLTFLTSMPGMQAAGTAQHISQNPQENSFLPAGFIYKTLILKNDSLVTGNVIRPPSNLNPFSIIYDPYVDRVYLSYEYSHNISIFNGTTFSFIGNVTLPFRASQFLLLNQNGSLLIYSSTSQNTFVLNKNGTLKPSFQLEDSPSIILFDPYYDLFYALLESGPIEIINAETHQMVSELPLFATDIIYDSSTHNLYALNFTGTRSEIVIIQNETITGSKEVDGSGIFLTLNTRNQEIDVQLGGGVEEFNASTLSYKNYFQVYNYGPIYGIFYSSVNNYLYAISNPLSQLSVYNASGSFLTSMNTGIEPSIFPYGVCYDNATKSIILLNTGEGTVSIIPLNVTMISFQENGLESGSLWSVALGGKFEQSRGNTINFFVANGSYTYRINLPSQYTLPLSTGSVNVTGDEIIIDLNFESSIPLYPVRIYSVGLPPGIPWNVTVGNITQSTYNMAVNRGLVYDYITFFLPAGVYRYSIFSPGYHVVRPYSISWEWSIYSYNPFQPNFSSLGNLSTRGNITAGKYYAAYFSTTKYKVEFIESGLPAGTFWFVSYNDSYYTSTSSTLELNLPNGSYQFDVATTGTNTTPVLPSSGTEGFYCNDENLTLTVNSTPVVQKIMFYRNPSYFYANFSFADYPTGYPLAIMVGNLTEYSIMKSEVSFLLQRGNYSAHILLINRSEPMDPLIGVSSWNFDSKNFSLLGNEMINLTFYPPAGYYPVIVKSPVAKNSSVLFSLNGKYSIPDFVVSTNGTALFYLQNGTYEIYASYIHTNFTFSYNLTPEWIGNNYVSFNPSSSLICLPIKDYVPAAVSLNISGSGKKLELEPKMEYIVTFNISGLEDGEQAEVSIGGMMENTSSDAGFMLVNGSYNYTVTVLNTKGIFKVINEGGTTVVNGSNETVYVNVINFGYLNGSVYPSNATLLINGTEYKAQNGSFNISLAPGTYEVMLSSPGFETVKRTVTIEALRTSSLGKIILPRPPFLSSLVIAVVVAAIIISILIVASLYRFKHRGA